MIEMIQILLSHGFSGYLLIGTGLFCVLISLERFYFLYFSQSYDSTASLAAAKTSVMAGKYGQTIQICSQQAKNPEMRVLREGIVAVENGREAMRSALTSAVLEVSKACERRLSFLSLIASAATLIGLYGTIMGLIKTFQAIAGADPTEKARMLGLGISEAMHSTAGGVIIGIAAMAAHTVCTSRADVIIGKSQKVALDCMNWIEFSERRKK